MSFNKEEFLYKIVGEYYEMLCDKCPEGVAMCYTKAQLHREFVNQYGEVDLSLVKFGMILMRYLHEQLVKNSENVDDELWMHFKKIWYSSKSIAWEYLNLKKALKRAKAGKPKKNSPSHPICVAKKRPYVGFTKDSQEEPVSSWRNYVRQQDKWSLIFKTPMEKAEKSSNVSIEIAEAIVKNNDRNESKDDDEDVVMEDIAEEEPIVVEMNIVEAAMINANEMPIYAVEEDLPRVPMDDIQEVVPVENHIIVQCPRKGKSKPKQKIPKQLKEKVWDTYIEGGPRTGVSKCWCCSTAEIRQTSFICGHVIASSKGGLDVLSNLRPICWTCNSRMGTSNMEDWKRLYFGNLHNH